MGVGDIRGPAEAHGSAGRGVVARGPEQVGDLFVRRRRGCCRSELHDNCS